VSGAQHCVVRQGTPLDLRLKILRPLANDADRIGALFARIDGNGPRRPAPAARVAAAARTQYHSREA
jgi:hypothetical protein